jgi:prepilin-type N-terminal cleavage/methylation domain-containing protein
MNISYSCQSGRTLKSNAFTLVELLVVIAIILFLVGLLMPALTRVRETAKMTKCLSNMRQISMATFMYAADNDGMAPYEPYTVSRNEFFVARSHDATHPTYMAQYPKNKWFAEYLSGGKLGELNPIGYCPKGGVLGDVGPKAPKAPFTNFSYGMNPDLFEDWWITNGNPDRCSVPLSQIKSPARVCMWVESNKSKTYKRGVNVTGRHFANSKSVREEGPTMGSYTVYQYEGKMNVLFVDQHITSLKVPDEVAMWSCSFWDHARPPCNPGECPLCSKNMDY